MPVTESIVVMFAVLLCSRLRSPLSPLLSLIIVFMNMWVSLLCFAVEVDYPYADRTYICNWTLPQGKVSRE